MSLSQSQELVSPFRLDKSVKLGLVIYLDELSFYIAIVEKD